MKKYIFILLLLYVPETIYAHPHTFIENTVSIIFDTQGIAGIKTQWKFDEMFSSLLIADCDQDKDRKLSNDEVKAVKKIYFANLKKYNYFSHIEIDKKPFEVRYVKDFNASIQDNRIVYTFLIPCHVKATSKTKKITIGMYDETYYSDLLLTDYKCIFLDQAERFFCDVQVMENTNNKYYYGQISPTEVVVTFKKKK